MWNVEDWMTPNPELADADESAPDALERMTQGGFRHLPVVNAKGVLIGLVSIDDLRAALPFDAGVEGPLPESRRAVCRHYPLAELMTYLPASATAKMSLEQAVHLLLERRIGCLPVVDGGGAPIGILTESDSLRALLRLLSRSPRDAAARWERSPSRASALEALAVELRAEQNRIRAELVLYQSEERALAAAQHGEPLDVADRVALTDAGALAGGLAQFAAARFAEIGRALERAERGELGTCAQCRCPMPLARLRAVPGAQLCMRCARAAGACVMGRPAASRGAWGGGTDEGRCVRRA